MLPVILTIVMIATIVLTIISIKQGNKKVALLIVTSSVSIIASVLLTTFVYSVFVIILTIPVIHALLLMNLLESKKRYLMFTLAIVVITGCIEMGICLMNSYQHEISVKYTITIVEGKTTIDIDNTPADLKSYVDNVVKNNIAELSHYTNVEYKGKVVASYICDYPKYKNHDCTCNDTTICENCQRYAMLNRYANITLYENIIE